MSPLREWYEGLAERERKMLAVLGVALVAFALFLVPYGTSAMLSSRRDHNEELRKAIALIQRNRGRMDEIEERKEAVAKRYDNPAPALAGFIENAARKSGLEIPESQDRADLPHGKKFIERSTVVRLRKVPLLPLVKMLESLENSGHPIVISRLNIRRRGRQPDSYDVELGVSAFDRVKKKKKSDEGPAGASSGGNP